MSWQGNAGCLILQQDGYVSVCQSSLWGKLATQEARRPCRHAISRAQCFCVCIIAPLWPSRFHHAISIMFKSSSQVLTMCSFSWSKLFCLQRRNSTRSALAPLYFTHFVSGTSQTNTLQNFIGLNRNIPTDASFLTHLLILRERLWLIIAASVQLLIFTKLRRQTHFSVLLFCTVTLKTTLRHLSLFAVCGNFSTFPNTPHRDVQNGAAATYQKECVLCFIKDVWCYHSQYIYNLYGFETTDLFLV